MKGLLTCLFSTFIKKRKGINLTEAFWRQSTNVTVTVKVSEFAARAPFSNLNTNRTPKALGIFLHFDKWKGEFGVEQLAMYRGEGYPRTVLSLWCLLNALRSVFTLFNSYTPHLVVAYTRAAAYTCSIIFLDFGLCGVWGYNHGFIYFWKDSNLYIISSVIRVRQQKNLDHS